MATDWGCASTPMASSPVVTTDAGPNGVLMVWIMNAEALQRTLATGGEAPLAALGSLQFFRNLPLRQVRDCSLRLEIAENVKFSELRKSM